MLTSKNLSKIKVLLSFQTWKPSKCFSVRSPTQIRSMAEVFKVLLGYGVWQKSSKVLLGYGVWQKSTRYWRHISQETSLTFLVGGRPYGVKYAISITCFLVIFYPCVLYMNFDILTSPISLNLFDTPQLIESYYYIDFK